MGSDDSFSFPNPMNSSYPAPYPNSMDSSNPALTNSEEHDPHPFSNTKPPMFNPGAGIGMSNEGQSGGSNDGQSGGSNDGQVSGQRARGRPRGSKNKRKETVPAMTSIMKSVVLEIPPGSEVVEWLNQYAHSKNIFMNVLGGAGVFSQAAISHIPSEHPTIFSEQLCMFSFTGTAGEVSPRELSGFCSFTASFGRISGTVIGGTLRGLVTSGPMVVNALISDSPPEVIRAGYENFA